MKTIEERVKAILAAIEAYTGRRLPKAEDDIDFDESPHGAPAHRHRDTATLNGRAAALANVARDEARIVEINGKLPM